MSLLCSAHLPRNLRPELIVLRPDQLVAGRRWADQFSGKSGLTNEVLIDSEVAHSRRSAEETASSSVGKVGNGVIYGRVA